MEEKILVLKGLLEKAYKLETSFENETVFRAFLSELSDEQRKVLFELMSDSERHKIKIEKLARDLGFELEKSVEKLYIGISPQTSAKSLKKKPALLKNLQKMRKGMQNLLKNSLIGL